MTDIPEEEWFHMEDGEVSGPRSFQELKEMLEKKTLLPKALVWTESMDKWKSADEIPGLVPRGETEEKPRLIRTSERAKVQSYSRAVEPEASHKTSPALTRTSERAGLQTQANAKGEPKNETASSSVVEARARGTTRRIFFPPVSTGEWMWTLLLTSIPVINIICFLVWAFGGNTAVDKANWAKAVCLWVLVWMLIYAAFFGLMLLAPSLLADLL